MDSHENEYQMALPFGQAASPAPTFRWLDAVRDWLEASPAYGSSFIALLRRVARDGLSSRMSLASSAPMQGETLQSCWEDLPESYQTFLLTAGETQGLLQGQSTRSPIACSTRSFMEYHSGAVVCSLSDTLETPEDWLERHPNATREEWDEYIRKYSLSVKARRGILRRAEKRGKGLPEMLHRALSGVEDLAGRSDRK